MASRIKNSGPMGLKTGKKRAQKAHRILSPDHLSFVHDLPCLVTGSSGVDAHHLTVDRYRMGRKAGDDRVVPLSPMLHTGGPNALHSMGEKNFWNVWGVDPRSVATFLWEHTGDFDACVTRIREAITEGQERVYKGENVF